MKKIPILLVTHNRPNLLDKVLNRLMRFTPWDLFDLWILDNYSTLPNKRIIQAYKEQFMFINVFSQNFNQISEIQNQVISILKSDLYIKIDDDILVTKNWYKGFLGVYERNSSNISIGSVLIPINGFGWVPFIQIMGLTEDFSIKFPKIELKQGCTDPAVWNNNIVNNYIWQRTLDLDKTSEEFIQKTENSFSDYEVKTHYSIGAIIFSHEFWQKMGGWKVEDGFYRRLKTRDVLVKLSRSIAKIRRKARQNRIDQIIDIITRTNISALGIEEEHVFKTTKELGLKQYVTSESMIYHFAFHTTEEYLMKKVFLKINW